MLLELSNYMEGKQPKVPSAKKLTKIINETDPYLVHGFFVTNLDRAISVAKDAIKYLYVLDSLFTIKPEKCEDEELIKIYFRLLNEYSGKTACKSAGVESLLKSIASKLNQKSQTFIKFLKQVLKKVDLRSLGNMSDVVAIIVNQEIIETIEARIKEEIGKIETQNVIIHPNLLAIASNGFFEEHVVNNLRRLLKKSVNNIPKVGSFMKHLETSKGKDIPKISKLEELLEAYLLDSLSKGDEFIINIFTILRSVLAFKKEYANKTKVESFMANLNKKLYKNQNEELNYRYCDLVADMSFCFDEKSVLDTIGQFYESFAAISNNINKTNTIVSKVLSNTSFSQPFVFKWILDQKKYDSQPIISFIIFNRVQAQEDNSIKFLESYKSLLHDNFIKNSGKKLTNSSYPNVVYSLYYRAKDNQVDDKLSQEAYKMFLARDNLFLKPNLIEVVPYTDCHILLIALSKLNDKVLKTISKDPNERKFLGWLLVNLLHCTKKVDQREQFMLSKIKVKSILEFLFLYSIIENDQYDIEKYKSIFEDALIHSDCKLSFKKSSTLNKLIYLLGNRKLINNQLFYKLHKKQRFANFVPEGKSVPSFISSIFSKANLFSTNKLTFTPYAQLISSILYFFPGLAIDMSKIFVQNMLCSLTRMKKLCAYSKSVKGFDALVFCDKSDVDFLMYGGIVSLTDSQKKQFSKIDYSIENEFFDMLNSFEENEIDDEEKFEELSNLNSQVVILEEYRIVMENATAAFKIFYKHYGNMLLPVHHERINDALKLLKPSLKNSRYLRNELKNTFILNFTNNLKDGSEIIEQLADIYFQILGYEDSPAFVRKLEYFVKKINLSKLVLSDDVFEILFTILLFAFESKIDAEYQRKLFKFVYEALQHYPDHLVKFYEFICQNLNELYFDEAFRAFEETFIKLIENNTDVIDKALNNILDYEEFAAKMVVSKLIALSNQVSFDNQIIQPIQKLKLLIMTESENSEIASFSKNLIDSHSNFKFGASTFQSFNFEKMLLEFPFDIQETISKIFKEIYLSLDNEHRNMFLEKIVKENRDLICNIHIDPNNSNIIELKLRLLVMILMGIKEYISVEHYSNIFQYIYGKLKRS